MSDSSTPRAMFAVEQKDSPGVLFRATAMHDAISNNAAMFPALPIAMLAFLALITAFATAQQSTTATRARGSATLRNTKRYALWLAMVSLRNYVQSLADNAQTAEIAASIIQSAGLLVARTGTHYKPVLAASLTAAPGVVHLVANATVLAGKAARTRKVTFNWQWSDDGGTTWNDARSTGFARTDIQGLALMTRYSFRVCVTISEVAGPWSQPVTLVVH